MQPQALYYDARVGRYRRADGRFVRRAEVLEQVDQEIARQRVRLKAKMRLWRSGQISKEEFISRCLEDLALSSIRMSALSSGGIENMSAAHDAEIEALLKDLVVRLEAVANKDEKERDLITLPQALVRVAALAAASKAAFFLSEVITRQNEGRTLARRSLDPQANHCSSCLEYTTNGEWLPIEQVVPPTVNCLCRLNCRCRIEYR